MIKNIFKDLSPRMIKGISLGLAAAAAAILVLSFIISLIVYHSNLTESSLPAFALAIIVIAAFGGGFLAARLNGSRGLINGLICGLALFCLLLILRSGSNIPVPLQLLCCCLPGMAGGFLAIK